jgi:hypothetical protein
MERSTGLQLETRNTQEGAKEVVDESMRLDPRDCSMLALHDVEALVLHFDNWSKATFLRSRYGDWSEYIVLEDYCMEDQYLF